MTSELLAAVNERFDSYARGGRSDPSLVLGDDVTEAAAELWRSVIKESSTGAVPFQVVLALAWLHWARYCALPTGKDRNDFQIATVMFGHIFAIDPRSVPDELRDILSDAANCLRVTDSLGISARYSQSAVLSAYPGALELEVRTGPYWQVAEASAIVRDAKKNDWTADLDHAIYLLRAAANVMPHADPSWASTLSSLIDALELRFERAGDPADQDEAVEVAHAAVAEYPANSLLLYSLAVALNDRGRKSGSLGDLDEAIAASRGAVEMTSSEHSNYVGSSLLSPNHWEISLTSPAFRLIWTLPSRPFKRRRMRPAMITQTVRASLPSSARDDNCGPKRRSTSGTRWPSTGISRAPRLPTSGRSTLATPTSPLLRHSISTSSPNGK